MKTPIKRYRPVRTSVDGGFTETLSESVLIYGQVKLYEEKMEVGGVDTMEDVAVGDIIEIEV